MFKGLNYCNYFKNALADQFEDKSQFPQTTKLRGDFSITLDFLMLKYKCIFVYILICNTGGHTVSKRLLWPFSPYLFKTAHSLAGI